MKQTRWITEGAVLLAIFIVLLLVSLYVPVLSILALLAQPIPFIIFALKHEMKRAWIFLLVAILLSFIFTVPIAVVNVAFAGAVGIVIGALYKRQRNTIEILLLATVIYMVNFVVLYIISVQLLEQSLLQEMQEGLTSAVDLVEKFAKQTNMKVDEKQLMQLKEMPKLFKMLLPSLLVMASLMMSWLTLVVANPVLKRLRLAVPPWPSFRDVTIPRNILWYYMLVILISVFVPFAEESFVTMALSNLKVVFPLLFVLQGFSFIAFFSHFKGYNKAIPIILFILSFVLPFLFSIVMFLGIIDLGISLRARLTNR